MYIKIINCLFWWIVASTDTWHQMNPWLSSQSLPLKAKPKIQWLHQKTPPKQYTPLARPRVARRGTAKNHHAPQVRL